LHCYDSNLTTNWNLPTCDNNNLYFYFTANENFYENISKFFIKLQFIDNFFEENVLYKLELDIRYDGQDIITTSKNTSKSCEIISGNPQKVFRVCISLVELGIQSKSRPAKLCYNVILCEKIYKDIFHRIKYDSYLNDNFVEFNVLQI